MDGWAKAIHRDQDLEERLNASVVAGARREGVMGIGEVGEMQQAGLMGGCGVRWYGGLSVAGCWGHSSGGLEAVRVTMGSRVSGCCSLNLSSALLHADGLSDGCRRLHSWLRRREEAGQGLC